MISNRQAEDEADRVYLREREAGTRGHGHVVPNADGSKARCGGPSICKVCQREAATHAHVSPGLAVGARLTTVELTDSDIRRLVYAPDDATIEVLRDERNEGSATLRIKWRAR